MLTVFMYRWAYCDQNVPIRLKNDENNTCRTVRAKCRHCHEDYPVMICHSPAGPPVDVGVDSMEPIYRKRPRRKDPLVYGTSSHEAEARHEVRSVWVPG